MEGETTEDQEWEAVQEFEVFQAHQEKESTGEEGENA